MPRSGRSPGGNGNPLQYSCLKNPMDRGAWQATVHGVPKCWTWLSNWTHTQRHTHTSTGCACAHTYTHTHTPSPWGTKELDTIEQLNEHTYTHTSITHTHRHTNTYTHTLYSPDYLKEHRFWKLLPGLEGPLCHQLADQTLARYLNTPGLCHLIGKTVTKSKLPLLITRQTGQ